MRKTSEKIAVIVVAGGSGSRMGGPLPKQFLLLRERPVLACTLENLYAATPDAEFVVALPEREIPRWEALCAEFGVDVPHRTVAGAATRAGSVKNALQTVGEVDYILVHDGVRPLVSAGLIARVLETARRHGTAVPAVAPADSFRIVEPDCEDSRPVDRTLLRAVQTPQAFDAELLRRAYARDFDPAATDDATLVERTGVRITLCEGDPRNLKITTPEDLAYAEIHLKMSDLWHKE